MSSRKKPHPLESLSFHTPAAPAPQPAPPSSRGDTRPAPSAAPAPTEPEEATRSSNVTLPVSVWEWVDRKHVEARSRGGAAFRKAAIIRAAFAVAMSAEADIAGAQSEEEIVELMIGAIVLTHGKPSMPAQLGETTAQ